MNLTTNFFSPQLSSSEESGQSLAASHFQEFGMQKLLSRQANWSLRQFLPERSKIEDGKHDRRGIIL